MKLSTLVAQQPFEILNASVMFKRGEVLYASSEGYKENEEAENVYYNVYNESGEFITIIEQEYYNDLLEHVIIN